MSSLNPDTVIKAALRAGEILTGMGYHGKYGSIHLLSLKLQKNTITAILHNMIAWQISEIDKNWTFHSKGGSTPDLTSAEEEGIQIKATSNKKIKGNKVSANEGYYIAVKYDIANGGYNIIIREVLMGELFEDDWERREGTQWAILKPEAEKRLQRIYP